MTDVLAQEIQLLRTALHIASGLLARQYDDRTDAVYEFMLHEATVYLEDADD